MGAEPSKGSRRDRHAVCALYNSVTISVCARILDQTYTRQFKLEKYGAPVLTYCAAVRLAF